MAGTASDVFHPAAASSEKIQFGSGESDVGGVPVAVLAELAATPTEQGPSFGRSSFVTIPIRREHGLKMSRERHVRLSLFIVVRFTTYGEAKELKQGCLSVPLLRHWCYPDQHTGTESRRQEVTSRPGGSLPLIYPGFSYTV